jgi:hypothetical protein
VIKIDEFGWGRELAFLVRYLEIKQRAGIHTVFPRSRELKLTVIRKVEDGIGP